MGKQQDAAVRDILGFTWALVAVLGVLIAVVWIATSGQSYTAYTSPNETPEVPPGFECVKLSPYRWRCSSIKGDPANAPQTISNPSEGE